LIAHSDSSAKSGQVSQELTVVTGAPRRLATAVLAVALLLPTTQLVGGVAWAAVPTPSPDVTGEPVAPDLPPDAPFVEPSIGTWIIGGTELEGAAARPPSAVKPVVATSHTTVGTTTHRVTSRQPASTPAADATVLPFTGGHVTTLAPTGLALLVGGVVLMIAARPRRSRVRL
jgi:hypothetical protein